MENRPSRILAEICSGTWFARIRAGFWGRRTDSLAINAVARWHVMLCVLAVLNIALWMLAAVTTTRAAGSGHVGLSTACLLQMVLSAVYVLGCAYRSVMPVYDIPRIVLVDSPLSSVFVGRSIATVAELCFAAQWVVMLHRMAFLGHSLPVQIASLAIIPLIVIAEVCSWHAILTTAQRGHVFENSIWGVAGAVVIGSLLAMDPHRGAQLYPPIIVWCVGGSAYVAYIFLFDVPVYWARWLADKATGRRYLSLAQGVIDSSRRRVVSYKWAVWKDEVPWMSLYFAFGVWTSISLIYASLSLGA